MNEQNESNRDKDIPQRLDACEQNLENLVKDFSSMITAAVELYDKPDETQNLKNSVKNLAERLKTFKTQAIQVANDLPNDEPVNPHISDFDTYLLNNSKIFIMNKIRDIKTLAEKKYQST